MNKIYNYVYYLSEVLGHRLTATKNEKKAGDWVFNKIQSFQLEPVMEEFSTPSSAYSFFQFIFLLGFFISLFYSQFHYILKVVFLIIEFFLIILFYKESVFSHTFIYKLLKRKKSQNIYTEIVPKEEHKKTVYISTHIDSATAGLLFHPSIVKYLNIQMKISFISLMVLFVNSIIYFLLPGHFLVIIFIILSCFYFVSFFVTFHTEYLARPVSGANDNASSVGVSLGLIEYFSKNRLKHTKLVGLYTGAEETGCVGIYEYLKKHKSTIDQDANFIVMDCTGIGKPVFLKSEGMLKKYYPDKKLLHIAEDISNELEYKVEPVDLPIGYTELNVVNNFGYKGITIGAAPEEKDAVPNWHQMNDNIIYIRRETLKQVFNFVMRMIKKIDE